MRRAVVPAAACLAVLVAACADVTTPQLTVTATGSRSLALGQDSAAVTPDSAVVALTGAGSAAARWTAAHGGGRWLTIVTAGGTGSAPVRWVVDPVALAPGTYVDTITITAAGAAGSPARIVDSLTILGAAAQFVTVRRPWLPGERDSAIAFVQRNHSLDALGYDLSPLAPDIFAGDSTTVVVPNPDYRPPSGSGVARAAAFASGWTVVGVQLFIQNKNVTPNDTLSWLGVLWYNPADSTWKGLVLAATLATTLPLTTINTTSFGNSGDKTGAGGGEAQQSTGTYWEANGGQIQITQNSLCFGSTTLTSGPYEGGTENICFFGGQLVNVTMPRLQGTTAPTSQTVSLDFRNNLVFGARLSCVFPSPCTSVGAPPGHPGFNAPTTVRGALLGR
ncbi:MAG TPA: hypothetical protein VEH83_09165 [Gemmatimonadales bacterium]|nr:hypothetical protein [Gemmatimonadales bacterium]